MIMFKVRRQKNGKIVRLTILGHAGYADAGRDIVCAAASTSLWMAISHIDRASLAKVKTTQEDARVECTISPKREEGADILLDALIECMQTLAKQYPKYLFITEV